jgi:glutathione S-transferase
MAWVTLITALAVIQFVAFGIAVGSARGKYNVHAPATSGHEIFDRYFRVHMNTLEQLVAFLPALWLFATQVNDRWAAILGAVYLAGRMLYFFSYVKDPKSRSLGFVLSAMPTMIMLVGVLYAVVRDLRTSG